MEMKIFSLFVFKIGLVFTLLEDSSAAKAEVQNAIEPETSVETLWNQTRTTNQDIKKETPLKDPIQGQLRITKRDTHNIESHIKCSETHVEGRLGIEVVKEITSHKYVFFLKPLPNFQKVIFNMVIDNNFNLNAPYLYGDSIALTSDDLKGAEEDKWIEIQVEYYKHLVRLGRDKLALRVKMGNLTRELITSRWWRMHTYMGFRVSAEGGADFLFDCVAQSRIHPNPVSGVDKPLLLGGILGGCFLFVIGGWVLYLFFRQPRRHHDDDQQPPAPPLPASLMLRSNKVNNCPDVNHIYEEFDEDTLSRLRHKMSPKSLMSQEDQDLKTAKAVNEFPSCVQVHQKLCKEAPSKEAKKASDPVYMNDANMTLIDEKMKASFRDSAPESHYIEMHGILNRPSVDLGN